MELIDPVVVAADLGFAKRARNFANMIGGSVAFVEKRRLGNDSSSETLGVIGDVRGKTAIIMDDEIDTAGTIVNAAEIVRREGARDVIAACTHAVLSGPAVERIENSSISTLVTTDTCRLDPTKRIARACGSCRSACTSARRSAASTPAARSARCSASRLTGSCPIVAESETGPSPVLGEGLWHARRRSPLGRAPGHSAPPGGPDCARKHGDSGGRWYTHALKISARRAMLGWVNKLLGGRPWERELKRVQPLVEEINEIEPELQELDDAELRDKTTELRGRLLAGEELDNLLPEAFAAVREAARRTIGMRHYDVQLIGGAVLHSGQDRRDADRRGQDAGRHAAALPERPDRQGRPPRHRQRLPRSRATRSGWARSTTRSA